MHELNTDETRKIIEFINKSEEDIQYDTFYYLVTQVDLKERESLEALLKEDDYKHLYKTYQEALNAFDEYGKSFGEIKNEAKEIEHLKYHIGRLKYFSEPRVGIQAMGVPDYYEFGSKYLTEIKKELFRAFCSNDKKYSKDVGKIREFGQSSITLIIPIIMSVLSLPTSLSGIAIVLSIFISKVGFNALCNTLESEFKLEETS